ncbi:MAG: hypothetical protein ACJ8H8_27840 [Geminicoccaceae bacterium]
MGEPTLTLVSEKHSPVKLPKFDLNALLSVHKANLATASQVQTILVDAVQAVALAQYAYVSQAVAHAKVAVSAKALPKPEAVMADARAAAEKAIDVTKQVVNVTVGAQKQVAELAAQRLRASVTELKALGA